MIQREEYERELATAVDGIIKIPSTAGSVILKSLKRIKRY